MTLMQRKRMKKRMKKRRQPIRELEERAYQAA
jgi:hypothetical protein